MLRVSKRKRTRSGGSQLADLFVKISTVKGRCVHTSTKIHKGTCFLKYKGNLCTKEPEGDDKYMFEFKWKGNRYWIDSTTDDGSFGRLVNYDHCKPNCKVKVDDSKGKPELFFQALRDIESGEEILYNYGVGPYPWRKKRGKCNSEGEILDGGAQTELIQDTQQFYDNHAHLSNGTGLLEEEQVETPSSPKSEPEEVDDVKEDVFPYDTVVHNEEPKLETLHLEEEPQHIHGNEGGGDAEAFSEPVSSNALLEKDTSSRTSGYKYRAERTSVRAITKCCGFEPF